MAKKKTPRLRADTTMTGTVLPCPLCSWRDLYPTPARAWRGLYYHLSHHHDELHAGALTMKVRRYIAQQNMR